MNCEFESVEDVEERNFGMTWGGGFLNYSFNIPCFGVYTYSVCIRVCVNVSAGLQEMDREREGRSRGAFPTWCGSKQ